MQKVSLSNKVFTDNPLLDEIVYNARQIATGVVVKDWQKANDSETVESIQNGDALIACTRGTATFGSFEYDIDILYLYYGETVPYETLLKYSLDNSLIPQADRSGLFNFAKTQFLENYVEYNNYYRQLNGEPYYDETGIWEGLWIDTTAIDESYPTSLEYIYKFCPDPLDETYQLIHKLDRSLVDILDSNGTIENIVNATDQLAAWELTADEVRYLQHLGEKSVDYYTARTAEKFALLYCPSSDSEEVQKRFKDLFEANRLYTLYTIYSEAYKYKSDYYDNFIMAMLVIQTIIDMIIELPEYIIRRDIFDSRTCKYIFESNGVKYFSDIPIKYQVSLVKNLNKLIKFKSTDKCILDIVSLFGISNINVFKYYILKDRQVGNPDKLNYYNNKKTVINTLDTISQGTTINKDHIILTIAGEVVECTIITYDEDAEVKNRILYIDGSSSSYSIVEDNDENYELKFIKVPLQGKYDDYIRTEKNIYDYDSLVDTDAYWEGDKDYDTVKSEIKDLDFTVLRSKYYSIEAVVDLTRRNFTLVYFLNIFMFNKVDSTLLKLSLPNVSTTKKFTLINTILTLYSLSYIYYGVEDTIVDSRLKVAHILGFNMEADLAAIATELKEKHGGLTLEDLHVDGFIIPSNEKLYSFDELQNIFFTNKDVYDFVQQMLIDPPNKRIYDAYKYIYDSIFIMNCNMEYFLVGDISIVTQYKSLGYTTKFIHVPRKEDYSTEELFEKDYAYFLSRCEEDELYFDISDDFDSDHLFNLYVYNSEPNEIEKVGEVRMASTYREFLRYNDATLYNFIQEIATIPKEDARKEACVNAIQAITTYLKDYITEVDINVLFSNLPSISLDFIKKYVEEVIDFFRSFKIFTHGSSIIYTLDDKFESYVKLIDDILIKYLLSKSELVRIEDHINGKIENISGLLLHTGFGIANTTTAVESVDMIDKVWLEISTWIYKNFSEYYNSDRYSEFTDRIQDLMTKYRVYKTLESEEILVEAIMELLVNLSYTENMNIYDTLALNETRIFSEYYNQWIAEVIYIVQAMRFVEGVYTGTIYFCPECNKQVEASTITCPYCQKVITPTEKKLYTTHISDVFNKRYNKMRYNQTLKGLDGITSSNNKLTISDAGINESMTDSMFTTLTF